MKWGRGPAVLALALLALSASGAGRGPADQGDPPHPEGDLRRNVSGPHDLHAGPGSVPLRSM